MGIIVYRLVVKVYFIKIKQKLTLTRTGYTVNATEEGVRKMRRKNGTTKYPKS